MIDPSCRNGGLLSVVLLVAAIAWLAGPAPGAAGDAEQKAASAIIATDVFSAGGGESSGGTFKVQDTFGQGPIGPVAVGASTNLYDGFWATITAKGAEADTTPPEHVDSFTATATDDGVILRWTNPSDTDFAGTMVRFSIHEFSGDPTEYDPVPNGTGGIFYGAPASADSFVHTGLAGDTTYYYSAFAFDGVPNYAAGRYASATPVDTIPPTAVAAFTATAGDTTVTLRWTNSGDADFKYALVRFSTSFAPTGPTIGTPVPNGNNGTFGNAPASVDSFVHTHLTNGTTYYYSIWCADEVSNYSGYWDDSATPQDTIPPGFAQYFTVIAGERSDTLKWQNPADADFEEVRIRYSTTGWANWWNQGTGLENGSDGVFAGLSPGGLNEFVHTGLTAGVTYNYSLFTLDEAGNCPGFNSASATPFDNTPPTVAVSVFQNPYLTNHLDVYLIASEPVSDSSVVVTVGDDEVEMTANDAAEYVWRGDFDLCCTGDLTIKGCARDLALNRACDTREYSSSLLQASSGGVARSPDGAFELTARGGLVGGDTYLLVSEADARPAAVLSAYEVSPGGLAVTGFVELSIACPESASALEHFSVVKLVGAEAVPLDSYLDVKRGRVLAYDGSLGCYGLMWRPDAVTPVYGEAGLTALQNTPNPFVGSTTVRFELGSAGQVGIEIVGVDGRVVRTLYDEFSSPGRHAVNWDGRDDSGRAAAAGVYVCKARFGSETVTHKMVHMR